MIAEQYKNRYFINGISLFNEWGVIIEKGGYDELMKEPKRKNEYSHVWLDQNGTERFINNHFESRNVSLIFTFVCTTLADYLTKKDSLFNLIKGNKFTLSATTLGREWQLLYDNESNLEYLTDIYAGGLVVARHTLNFFDDDVVSGVFNPLVFLTDEQGNYLTDEEGNYLTQQNL